MTLDWKSKYLGLIAGLTVMGETAFSNTYNDAGLKSGVGYWFASPTRTVQYDGLRRPTAFTVTTGDQFGNETATFNPQDRRTAALTAGGTVNYTFTASAGPEKTDSFAAPASLVASNGAPRRVGGAAQPAGGTFQYDGRENMTEDDRFIYTWDNFDRIVKVQDKLGARGRPL